MDVAVTTEHFDVLIVGAGISGVGAAHHLKEQCADKSYVILESKATHGGTWETHKYPGIRSDSDLYTFGYRFKPWSGHPIAGAKPILDYMEEVIEEDKTNDHVRYRHEVTKASWDSDDKLWHIDAKQLDTNEPIRFTANFLWMCQGYYDHKNPYTPEWKGMDDFKGRIVHPQIWPEDLDYKGKRVIVIGSGATAATLIPSMADECEHVTMLQRSPTYFWTGENRNELADHLRSLEVPEEWVHDIVRRDILNTAKAVQDFSVAAPEMVKEELLKVVREQVGDDELVEKHFTPTYRPWQQRLAYVPDGDLFDAVKSGKVSITTDHIARFTEGGILTKSGEELKADIIITATGFNLLPFGGIPFEIDDKPVDFSKTFTHRGMMLSGLPNMVYVFGYLRTSWTMRVDLICDYVCRLLNRMGKKGATVVTPTLQGHDVKMKPRPWIEEEDFNSGYLLRGIDKMPRQGDHAPWTFNTNYYTEKDEMPTYDIDDPTMVYS